MKRYVGIDISSKCGFIIRDEEDNIIFEDDIQYKYQKDPERMSYIKNEILSHLNKETDIICMESFSYNSKGSSASFQYGTGYVIRTALYELGFTWTEVTPTQLKKFATSNASAKKPVVMASVKKRWGFVHNSDNIVDAFVLSEIVKCIDQGNRYNYLPLKEHEKQVILTVKKGLLNKEEWKESPKIPWKNSRSKYYFIRGETDK